MDDGELYNSLVCPQGGGGGRAVGGGDGGGGGTPDEETPRIYTLEEFLTLTPEPLFLRGDVNWDEELNLTDPIRVLGDLFLGTQPLDCQDAADMNDDGKVDISDAVAILSYLFLGTFEPIPPIDGIGTDPTEDGLGCGE